MSAAPPPVHPTATRGFGRDAGDYERGRPGYPTEAVLCLARTLGLLAGTRVLDLGAGTGKLTEALFALPGVEVIAVEPSAEMRAACARRAPEAQLLEGTAEAIPLPEGSVHAVVCGQAFHWFRGAPALREIRRVLRPGGGLGLLWNMRDESQDWVARFGRIVHAHRGESPYQATGDWREPFDDASGFTPLAERRFPHAQRGDEETIVSRAISMSYISALPPAERETVAEAVRALLRSHPQTRGRREIELPYRTEVYWCRRR